LNTAMLVHALLSCQAAQTWHADNCLLALIPAAAENPTGGWSVPLWVGEGSCSHVLNARHQIRIITHETRRCEHRVHHPRTKRLATQDISANYHLIGEAQLAVVCDHPGVFF
jgi:hypothetical protein